MVVQRRVMKQRNFWKILGVILIVLCAAGLAVIAAGSFLTQVF